MCQGGSSLALTHQRAPVARKHSAAVQCPGRVYQVLAVPHGHGPGRKCNNTAASALSRQERLGTGFPQPGALGHAPFWGTSCLTSEATGWGAGYAHPALGRLTHQLGSQCPGAWIGPGARAGGGGWSCGGGGFIRPALLCPGQWDGCAQMRGGDVRSVGVPVTDQLLGVACVQ